MKYILGILFFAALGSIITGFVLKPAPVAETCIGLGVVGLFFVVIPIFTYMRWRKRNLSDYMLDNDSFKKMRDFGKREDDSV